MKKSFCELLPKIEMHAHLNGSINVETLNELRKLNQQNGENQQDDKTWREWQNRFMNSEIPSLSECFEIFKVSHSVTITPMAVQMATEKVIEDFAKDNVIYLELRSTLRKEASMSKSQYIESMIKGIKNCKNQFPEIIVKLIVSLNRKESLLEASENIDLAIKYAKTETEIVTGIDLSGDPNEKTFNDYVGFLNKARKEGLKITVHFAEVPNDKEIHDILKYKPDRLGHATCVHELHKGNADNWNLLLQSKIPVEVCMTSNVKCKTVPSFEEHHFRFLYEAKHPISLSTDDKSVFQTKLSNEFEIVQQTFKLTSEDLWLLSYNAVNYIFSDDSIKSRLKDQLILWKKSAVGEPL